MKPSPEIVSSLQEAAYDACLSATNKLVQGMSERDIAELLRSEFDRLGITDYWYDVPLNVLVGADRFETGTTTTDYLEKAPSDKVRLTDNATVFMDVSPVDSRTATWGDWSTTFLFNPSPESRDQLLFLEEVRSLQRDGIKQVTSETTGAHVARFFVDSFRARDISLLDVRQNVGHSIHVGSKIDSQRIWLDEANNEPLGSGIFTVEPGGMRLKHGDKPLVARFEECIFVPEKGFAEVLGRTQSFPLFVETI